MAYILRGRDGYLSWS